MERLSHALIAGQTDEVAGLTKQALSEGRSAQAILEGALTPGMDQVGAQMKTGAMFIPEVLASARAMQAAMEALQPHFGSTLRRRGSVVIGTVKGDLHDLGKNLVVTMLEASGFQAHDLGTDTGPEDFVDAVKRYHPDIVAMSALLTTTMVMMQDTIDALSSAGVREQVKVMIGGAPLSADFAAQIGADAYGADALAAVMLARQFTGT
jgi:5-methyltetrahydrofolate--homocysteine methyltransferase